MRRRAQLEAVEVGLADYMLPHHVNSFKQAWDDLGDANEVVETFQLTTMTSLTSTRRIMRCGHAVLQCMPLTAFCVCALGQRVRRPPPPVDTVVEYLGMRPAERTGVVPADKTSHQLLLSGNLMGVARILVRCRLVYSTSTGVTMEMSVRSTDAAVSASIAAAIG